MIMHIFHNTYRPLLNTWRYINPNQVKKKLSTIARDGCPVLNPRYAKELYKENEVKYYPQNFLDKLLNRHRIRRRPPKECCRYCRCRMDPNAPRRVPDFVNDVIKEKPGSCVYHTPGKAFIATVPKNLKEAQPIEKTRSEKLISKIEEKADTQVEDVYNPMPNISNTSMRTIELNARKLHPLYEKYELPRRKSSKFFNYAKTDVELKHVRKPMELFKGTMTFYPKKKVFIDYKMSELPRYITSKIQDHQFSGMDIRLNTTQECCEKGKYHFTICPSPVCKLLKKVKTN